MPEGRMDTNQIREFLVRVKWRNVAALVAILLIVTAIVWVIAAPEMWTSAFIVSICAYPMAVLSSERAL